LVDIQTRAIALAEDSSLGTPEERKVLPSLDYFDLFTVPRLMVVSELNSKVADLQRKVAEAEYLSKGG